MARWRPSDLRSWRVARAPTDSAIATLSVRSSSRLAATRSRWPRLLPDRFTAMRRAGKPADAHRRNRAPPRLRAGPGVAGARLGAWGWWSSESPGGAVILDLLQYPAP